MTSDNICFILGVSHERYKPRLSDNFFEIGGTSINAVAVVSKINQGMKISIQDFIQAKTIGHLIMNKTNDLKKNLKPILSVVDDVKVDKYSANLKGFIRIFNYENE